MKLLLSGAATLFASTGVRLGLAARDAALLTWLAIEGPTPRGRLAALLWPESEPDSARNALRQRLFQLKKLSGVELVTGGTTLALADGVTHDLEDSEGVLGESAHEYSAEYSAWLSEQRERRRSRLRRSLAELSDMAERAHDYSDALSHANELLALDQLSEAAHRRVMRLHYLRGDRAAALLAFDRCEQMLKNDVGARPSAETLALLASIDASGASNSIASTGQVPASVLRPPRLIGRDAELAALNAGWQAEQVVALIGEAGMGKTRLLQSFIELHPGVVRSAGRPGDSGVPFATLARLLRAVIASGDDNGGALLAPHTRTEIARVLPEFEATDQPRTSEGQRLVLQRAVRALLTRQPWLTGLAVDDLHFADEASLEMLISLIDSYEPDPDERGNLAFSALRWALAYRPAEAGSPVQALHDVLAEQARLVPVTLAPLDEAALAALIDSLGLPEVDGRALAPSLLQRTGGNPLFVLETLKQAWVDRTLSQLARTADPGSMPRPVSVGRLIERRVGLLSPSALTLARVASVAGVDFSIALAEHVLGVPAMELADALNELASAQVLRGNAFAHDLVFDAVHASVPATIAAHTHGKVALWLEQSEGEPARIAAHWVAAGEAARALPWLHKAAVAARRALRSKEYIAFMERKSAIEEAGGDTAQAFRSLLLAASELVEVDPDAATAQSHSDHLDRLATTPALRVEASLHRAALHMQRAEFSRVHELSRGALHESLKLQEPALTARCHTMLASALGSLGQDALALTHLEASLPWLSEHGSTKDRSDAHGSLGVLYDNLARLDDALPHHEQGFSLACTGGDVANAVISCGNLACNRIDAGDLVAAERSLQQGQRLAAQYDAYGARAGGIQLLRALCLCHLGQYTDALQQAESGLQTMQQYQPGHVNHALLRMATCWWHLGQWSRMPQTLAQARIDEGLSLSARTQQALLHWRYTQATGSGAALLEQARQPLCALLSDIGDDKRPDLRLPLRIELAQACAADEALEVLERARMEAEAIGFLGIVLAARIRACAMATVADPLRGRREALAALELATSHQTTVLLPGELWLHCGRALVAAGDVAHGLEVLARGREWLTTTARDRLPASFRSSFMQRVAVNRELLATADALGELRSHS